MSEHGAAAIDGMLATIDAEMSECWKSDDRDRIFDAVRKTVGSAGINDMVLEKLRDLVVVETVEAIVQETDPTKLLGLKSALGKLYVVQGKYDLAEPLYVECLATRKEVLGDHHPDTLIIIFNLAGLHQSQGKYNLAEPLYVECLATEKEVLGDRHPDILASINNLAVLYESQGKYDLAEPLYVECQTMRKEVLGDRHPDTLTSMFNLAARYEKQGKYDLAEPLMVECLALKNEALGDRHPSSLMSMND